MENCNGCSYGQVQVIIDDIVVETHGDISPVTSAFEYKTETSNGGRGYQMKEAKEMHFTIGVKLCDIGDDILGCREVQLILNDKSSLVYAEANIQSMGEFDAKTGIETLVIMPSTPPARVAHNG